MKLYEQLASALLELGADPIFGLMGDGNLRFLTHASQQLGARYVPVRHENAAIAMADGYARITRRLGFCSVTQGPGLTNAITGLVEANRAGTPIVVVTGDTPTWSRTHNQDIDHAALCRSLDVAIEQVRRPELAIDDLMRACRRAVLERRPVVYSVPVDLQDVSVEGPAPAVISAVQRPPATPAGSGVDAVVAAISASNRPVILAGRGAVLSEAGPALRELGERIGALLATTAVAHGLFAGDPHDLRISGGFSSPLVADLLSGADLVLGFGASFTDWTTKGGTLFETAVVVQVDDDRTALGRGHRVDIPLAGDAHATASALLAALPRRDAPPVGYRTTDVSSRLAEDRPATFDDRSTTERMDPRTLMVALDGMLPDERIIVGDSGHFQGFPAIHLRVPDADGFIFAQDFQAVGLGLATGLGASFARPDRLTVPVVGDGGLMMSLGELDTIVRSGQPLLVIVMNDSAYGAEIHLLENLGMDPSMAFFDEIDAAALGRAAGADGLTVRSVADLEGVRDWLTRRDRPLVVDCKVNRDVRARWFQEVFDQRHRGPNPTGP